MANQTHLTDDVLDTPAAVPAPGEQQAPLGEHPTYDEVLDVAVEYTFPCSDPISVDSLLRDEERRAKKEEGR